MKVSTNNISLKIIHKKDWDFILELRNQFYSMFYSQITSLTRKEHYNYMEKQKSNSGFHHWLICIDDLPVGYVRILDNDVGIMIKKEFQKLGIASKALKLTEYKAKNLQIKKLVALIMTQNGDSINLFTKNGFEHKMNFYEKNLK